MFGRHRKIEQMFRGVIDTDEDLKSYCECTSPGAGRSWIAVTDRNVVWVDDRPGGTAKLMPHAFLVGYRAKAGYVRLGWQGPDDPTPLLLTAHARHDPHRLAVTIGYLNSTWSQTTGKPHELLRNQDVIPEFEFL